MSSPAIGARGHLIWCGDNVYRFRVYNDAFEFIDYDLRHSDLSVTITDTDATFYSDAKGNRLDHAPATLGIKE